MPEAAVIEPSETQHAPRTSRLLSGCSPSAAGSMISPITVPSAPTVINNVPVVDDIVKCLLAEQDSLLRSWGNLLFEHNDFFGLTPDDESHRAG